MSGNKEGLRGAPDSGGDKAGGADSKESAARTPKRSPGKLSRSDQNRIGSLLQRAYDDVLNEGVPERFKLLLDKLDGGGGGGGSAPTSAGGSEQQMTSQAAPSANSQNRESTE